MARAGERELTLQQAADRLGVHYMTAYRYVRTGQLTARRERGEWRLRVGDVDAFAHRTTSGGARRGTPRWSEHVTRVLTRMVSGDEAGAWQVLERALVNGAEPTDLYVKVLGPALERVGDRWAAGELTVEDEHRATTVASRLIGRLGPRFARPGRHRGTVVLGAAPDDSHALPTAMLADVLRGAGYAAIDLGGSTPVESFVSAAQDARSDSLVAVAVSASTTESVGTAQSVIEELRSAVPGVPLLLGGPAISDGTAAQAAGADAWAPDAAAVVRLMEHIKR